MGPGKEKTMKVLVVGATGLVGSEVVKALLQRGAEVRAFTRKQPKPGSKVLRKEIAYVGHADFDDFEAQVREKGSPSWLAYDVRTMYQGFVERGFSNTEDQAARFAALLGHQPRTYSSFAEELAREWAAA
jgi:NAD(P)-dependent dehydrogenase (short-subunit alcohol dehydrogenase family)